MNETITVTNTEVKEEKKTKSKFEELMSIPYQDVDLSQMDRSDLMSFKLEVEEAIDSIKSQLDAAKFDKNFRKTKGNKEEFYNWLVKAKKALRCKGRLHQRINAKLGSIKREHHSRWERMFITASKEILDKDVWMKIKDKADFLMEKTNG